MNNEQLKYYVEYNISPERQNIDNIEVHYARRKKLYRQCGLPEIAFRDAEILEVGPGGGYNTLAYFKWDCKHIDLVEANPQGIIDMQLLFTQQAIPENKYDIFECRIENYHTDKKYDIVIAEGIIPDISNQEEVIDKLMKLVGEKGIIVITCADKIGFFIEIMKRLVGLTLARNITGYEEKVRFLTDIFRPQLEKLRGASKLPEDWVKDIILNPCISNGTEFSLMEAIQYFKEEYEVLGTSPQVFTDYSWCKDIWYDYKKDYLDQFSTKRLSLLLANMPEIIIPANEVKILVEQFEKISSIEADYEKSLEMSKIRDILRIMNSMEKTINKFLEDDFLCVFFEIKETLSHLYNGQDINLEDYPHFFTAFGRTQQYISFVRK